MLLSLIVCVYRKVIQVLLLQVLMVMQRLLKSYWELILTKTSKEKSALSLCVEIR